MAKVVGSYKAAKENVTVQVSNRHAGPRYQRLRDAVQNSGGRDAVADRSGVGKTTLTQYMKDGDWKLSFLEKLAAACGVSMEWLISGRDPESAMPADLRHINEVLDYETGERHSMHDVVEFPRYDVRISAGDGALATSERMAGFIAIPRFMLPLHLQHAADHTIGLYVTGDSMVPTLSDNDLILVDTEVSSLVSGSVYAIRNEDEILVKRLNRTMTGDIEVISDNPRYQKQVINAELARKIWEDSETPLRIIGRVVWRGGSAPI